MLLPMLLLAMAPPQDAPFAWMVGTWCTRPRPSVRGTTCETWRPMVDGVMHGTSKTQRAQAVIVEEVMEIRRDGADWIFHAEPQQQGTADFRAGPGDVAALAVSFENAAHDYPQRVRYWRDGEKLMAEIAMADGSKPVTWEYYREK